MVLENYLRKFAREQFQNPGIPKLGKKPQQSSKPKKPNPTYKPIFQGK